MDKSTPPSRVRFFCPQNGSRVFCPVCRVAMTHKCETWAWPASRPVCDVHGPLSRGD